jgi:hypothetical protein
MRGARSPSRGLLRLYFPALLTWLALLAAPFAHAGKYP